MPKSVKKNRRKVNANLRSGMVIVDDFSEIDALNAIAEIKGEKVRDYQLSHFKYLLKEKSKGNNRIILCP